MATDEKLARGLTREIERLISRSSSEPRQQTFQFALNLLLRRLEQRKIVGSVFNVPLAALLKTVADNPANLSVVADRFRLGHSGIFHRVSLQGETIGHFRADGSSFQQNEWGIVIDEVRAGQGEMSANLWNAPVLFDPHFAVRYLQRTDVSRAERAIDLVETTLPLAVLIRDSALVGSGRSFEALDVALPAPGGVLCGGTELIDCAALAHKIKMGHREAGWGMDVIAHSTTLQMAVCIRTYLPEEVLSSGQFSAITALRQWYNEHRADIVAAPRIALGWADESVSPARYKLMQDVRALNSDIQQQFRAWRRNLERKGYFTLDFQQIADRYKTAAWVGKTADFDLIDQLLKSDDASALSGLSSNRRTNMAR